MSNKFPQLEWINVDGRQVPVPKVQHYKKGSTTETELTGHDNPFPVANYTQNSNGLWLPVSEDNPVPTQLTGSNVEYLPTRDMSDVEEIVVFDGLTVTDDSYHTSNVVDVGRYSKIAVMVLNDHDQPIGVRISSHESAPSIRVTRMWSESHQAFEEPKIVVPQDLTGGRWTAMHTHDAWFRYLQSPVKKVRFSIVAEEEIPTRGAITLVVWGVV